MVIYKTRWTHNLTFKLLNVVEDDPEIRQGLYPGTGANVSTANGGGKPKTDFNTQGSRAFFGRGRLGAHDKRAILLVVRKEMDSKLPEEDKESVEQVRT